VPGPSTPAPPPPGPAPRRRTRLVAAIAAVALLGLLALGAGLAVGAVWGDGPVGQTRTELLSTASGTGAVRIDNGCGSVQVREGAAGVVSTRARITARFGSSPRVASREEGGRVVVSTDCGRPFGGSVALTVEVPPGASLDAHSSAGAVEARGLSGVLTLNSSAGSVSGAGLRSREVEARSSAGSVTLRWADDADPRRVSAESSAGSVSVLLPDVAGTAYRVDADSSAGSTTVDVRTDPSSSREVRAHSSAGSVTVAYR
jgi:hypothetical protein